jgi:hypothetical protein
VLKGLAKQVFHLTGLKIERRDRLEESIPADYNHSPFLPRVYHGSLDRYLYFLDHVHSVRSTHSFDSFEGFSCRAMRGHCRAASGLRLYESYKTSLSHLYGEVRPDHVRRVRRFSLARCTQGGSESSSPTSRRSLPQGTGEGRDTQLRGISGVYA